MERNLLPLYGTLTGVEKPNLFARSFRFIPTNPEEAEKKGTLLVCLSLSTEQTTDLTNLGTQLTNSLNESYYQNQGSVTDSLKKAVESFNAKLKELLPTMPLHNLQVRGLVAVVWGQFLYLAKIEEGQVIIKRGSFFGPITFTQVASGRIHDQDWLFLANDPFWQALPKEKLSAILESESFDEVLKKIDEITGVAEGVCGVVAHFVFEEELGEEEKLVLIDPKETENQLTDLKANLLGRIQPLLQTLWVWVRKVVLSALPKVANWFKANLLKMRQPGALRGIRPRKTKAYVLLAIIILSLGLLGNLYFKSLQDNKADAKTLVQEAQEQYQEAESLQTLNAQKARELLTNAQEKIASAKKEDKNLKTEDLEKQIDDLLATLRREYRYAQLPLFYDLSPVRSGVEIASLASSGENLLAYDRSGSLILLDLQEKKASVVVQDSRIIGGQKMVVSGGVAFIMKDGVLLRYDLGKSEFLPDLTTGKADDFSVYNGNYYALVQGEVRRALFTDSGLSPTVKYTTQELDLSDSPLLSVDGFVWVVTEGSVLKFSRGERQDFSLNGLEKAFSEPTNVFSDETTANLYLLDRANQRVLVIEKTGSYLSQSISPQVGEGTGLLADEAKNRLYITDKTKIYQVDIKKDNQ
jgi:hypothetical protein